MSTQRQISHADKLPACKRGHSARHIHDCRRPTAGGGHFIECACGSTSKHPEYDDAMREWCSKNDHPIPKASAQRGLPLGTVTAIRRS